MKAIALKSDGDYSDKNFLMLVMENAPVDRGLTTAEVRQSIRIIDALEASDGQQLDLEDADYRYLVDRLTKLTWHRVDRRALGCVDRIQSLA